MGRVIKNLPYLLARKMICFLKMLYIQKKSVEIIDGHIPEKPGSVWGL